MATPKDNIRTVTFILEVNSRVAGFTNTSKALDKTHKDLMKIVGQMDKLEKAGKKDSSAYSKLNQEAQKLTGNLKEQIKAQAEYLSQLKLEQLSLNQLKVIRKQLLQTVSWAQADTREFRNASVQLRAVNEQMSRLKTLSGEAGRGLMDMGKFTGGITRLFAAFGLGVGVLTAVGNKLREIWQVIKDVSESYSDIRKVTNLNIPQATQLTGRLAGMDTRTSISDRMQLAVVGGRMGIDGVSQLTEFAKVADKIVVSLGDTLKGAPDEIITKMAKIVNAFDIGAKEGITFSDAMERVGSALNQVAAEGVASEEWQVDFLFRTGAIGRALKITAQNMLGFGVVLEEAGNTVEVSGTAISQFLGVIAKNVEDFAQKAQMPVEKFIHLLETDANQAIITVLQGIKDGATSNTELIRSFSQLGIDGERATKVILSLANNIDKVAVKQALANTEFDKNVSLTREYEKRQVSIGGAMERIGNNIQRLFVRSGLESWLKSIFNAMADISSLKPSEEMEKERIQLALTEAKLRDSNIAWEDKLDLIKELQNDYPGLFQNIETEADLYATLADNMERANEALAQKIMMQKNEEEISGYVKIQQDATTPLKQNLDTAFGLIDQIVKELPEEVQKQFAKPEGISSLDLEQYAKHLRAEYNKWNNTGKQGKGMTALKGIAAGGKFTLNREGFLSNFSRLDAAIDAIFYQEQIIKGTESKINDITAQQVERQKIIDTVLGKNSAPMEAPLTRQDFLETMRSVGSGGTVYQKYNPQTEKFIPGEVISEERLKEFRDVLALQDKIIAKSKTLGAPATAEELQKAFMADTDYDKYAEFLSVKGATLNLDSEGAKAAQKVAEDAKKRTEKMSGILTDMEKYVVGKLRETEIGQMDDFDAQRAKLSDQLQRAIDDYRAQYITASGGALSAAEQAALDTHVHDLENLKDKLLGVFDEKYREDLLERMFDLTATDEQKAFRRLDKDYKSYFDYWKKQQKKYLDEIAEASKEAGIDISGDKTSALSGVGERMQTLFGGGNVDLLHRPQVDTSKLTSAGWENAGDGYATVFSSQYGIEDSSGNIQEILVTPILPNGEVLSPSELKDYIYGTLQGASDILSADKKGIVISSGVSRDGNAGEQLHQLQELYYGLLNYNKATNQLAVLQGSYDQRFSNTVEKYKPEDQKREESKRKQVRNAQLMYEGIKPETAKETDQAREINELMYQLYADNWQAMYATHEAFLQADYDNEIQYLKDKVKAQQDAEKEIADFKRNMAVAVSDGAAQVLTSSISLEAEKNNVAMQKELERYEGNEKKQQEIRRKYAREEANLKAKQAVVDYMAGMVAVIAKSWGQGGIFGGVLAAVQVAAYTAALGFQLEQIQAAADAFADGKYDTVRTRDGKRYTARTEADANRTRFVNSPTYFSRQNALVGEEMPEIIISGPDTRYLRQVRPDVIEAIAALPGAQGFARGRYSGVEASAVPPPSPHTAPSGSFAVLDERAIQVLERLEQTLSGGIQANVVASERNMQPIQKGLTKLQGRQARSTKF